MRGPGKGVSGNPKGKPKGCQNRTTIAIKEWITKFIEDQRPDFLKAYGNLDEKDKVKTYLELMNYVAPKQSAVTSTITVEKKADQIIAMFPEEKEIETDK
jgi:hypothetical protein